MATMSTSRPGSTEPPAHHRRGREIAETSAEYLCFDLWGSNWRDVAEQLSSSGHIESTTPDLFSHSNNDQSSDTDTSSSRRRRVYTPTIAETPADFFHRLSLTDAEYLYELATEHPEVLEPHCRISTGFYTMRPCSDDDNNNNSNTKHAYRAPESSDDENACATMTFYWAENPMVDEAYHTDPETWIRSFIRVVERSIVVHNDGAGGNVAGSPTNHALMVALEPEKIVVLVLEDCPPLPVRWSSSSSHTHSL